MAGSGERPFYMGFLDMFLGFAGGVQIAGAHCSDNTRLRAVF